MSETLYKVLRADGSAYHGGSGKWPLPNGRPGAWVEVTGQLVACRRGLHVCRAEHLLAWLGPAIFTVETDGELLDAGDKLVARRARLLAPTVWTPGVAVTFAADCAERVLPIFEAGFPDDGRPRGAIEAARTDVAARAAAEAEWAARAAAEREWAARAAAARAAAQAAAQAAAEREWQTARLVELLHG